MNDRPLTALLVEDNPGDARLLREMLAEAKTPSFDLEHVETLSDLRTGLRAALDAMELRVGRKAGN